MPATDWVARRMDQRGDFQPNRVRWIADQSVAQRRRGPIRRTTDRHTKTTGSGRP